MIQSILHYLNYHSFLLLVGGAVLIIDIWVLTEYLVFRRDRLSRIVNIVMLLLTVFLILCCTVLFRDHKNCSVSLVPFRLLYRSFSNKVLFKSIVMNIILFVPLALWGCSTFRCRTKKSLLIITAAGAAFSVLIETFQYLFSLGMVDVDDVICNTLGMIAGVMIYLAYDRFLVKECNNQGEI